MSITNKAQAIIDNLYMYITLVDNELYINGVKHEATVVSVPDYTPHIISIGFLTMWCKKRTTDVFDAQTSSWSQVSPALGAPDTILHLIGSAVCYNIYTVDYETEDLQKQSNWSEICISEL